MIFFESHENGFYGCRRMPSCPSITSTEMVHLLSISYQYISNGKILINRKSLSNFFNILYKYSKTNRKNNNNKKTICSQKTLFVSRQVPLELPQILNEFFNKSLPKNGCKNLLKQPNQFFNRAH